MTNTKLIKNENDETRFFVVSRSVDGEASDSKYTSTDFSILDSNGDKINFYSFDLHDAQDYPADGKDMYNVLCELKYELNAHLDEMYKRLYGEE